MCFGVCFQWKISGLARLVRLYSSPPVRRLPAVLTVCSLLVLLAGCLLYAIAYNPPAIARVRATNCEPGPIYKLAKVVCASWLLSDLNSERRSLNSFQWTLWALQASLVNLLRDLLRTFERSRRTFLRNILEELSELLLEPFPSKPFEPWLLSGICRLVSDELWIVSTYSPWESHWRSSAIRPHHVLYLWPLTANQFAYR